MCEMHPVTSPVPICVKLQCRALRPQVSACDTLLIFRDCLGQEGLPFKLTFRVLQLPLQLQSSGLVFIHSDITAHAVCDAVFVCVQAHCC